MIPLSPASSGRVIRPGNRMSEASERARRLGEDSWEMALLVGDWLRQALNGPERDVKRAKELTGMLKDLVSLGRELGGSAPREITVRFVDGAEDAAG